MSGDKRQTRKMRAGVAACVVIAVLSLGVAVSQTRTLLHLLDNGQRADAVVVEIDVGVKGGKSAVFEFTTESGVEVTSRDLFQMYLVRYKPGDEVTVLYDASDPSTATIDMGAWMWQATSFLYFGFVLLFGLALVLPRMSRRGRSQKPGSTSPPTETDSSPA